MAIEDLLKSFDDLTQEQVAAVQAKSNDVLQVSTGSDLLALIESNSALTVWLQSIAVYLYAFARATTCVNGNPDEINPDLDSWMAQFKFPRLPATFATTTVTFSRLTTTQQAIITYQPTTQVTTQVGNIVFAVVKDTDNPNWNDSLNGYVMAANVASISVPVQAVVAGTSGNVTANQINLIVSAIPFVTSVNNPTDVDNAKNAESDLAYLTRFQLYINSLSKATPPAIEAAIESVQDNILYNVIENKNYALTEQLGFFTIIIDDGSGNPPDSLVTAVENIIEITRGLSIKYGVYKTIPVTATVGANLVVDPAYDASQLVVAVQAALTAYINSLDVAAPLAITKLPTVIYQVSPGILNIQNLLVNGSSNDVTPTVIQSIKAGTITLTTSNPS
jgi:uncharacterized phage protein gp47/JayE